VLSLAVEHRAAPSLNACDAARGDKWRDARRRCPGNRERYTSFLGLGHQRDCLPRTDPRASAGSGEDGVPPVGAGGLPRR
jgi:hypothetical protein